MSISATALFPSFSPLSSLPPLFTFLPPGLELPTLLSLSFLAEEEARGWEGVGRFLPTWVAATSTSSRGMFTVREPLGLEGGCSRGKYLEILSEFVGAFFLEEDRTFGGLALWINQRRLPCLDLLARKGTSIFSPFSWPSGPHFAAASAGTPPWSVSERPGAS